MGGTVREIDSIAAEEEQEEDLRLFLEELLSLDFDLSFDMVGEVGMWCYRRMLLELMGDRCTGIGL